MYLLHGAAGISRGRGNAMIREESHVVPLVGHRHLSDAYLSTLQKKIGQLHDDATAVLLLRLTKKHLALRRQRVRPLDEAIELLPSFEDRFDRLVLCAS